MQPTVHMAEMTEAIDSPSAATSTLADWDEVFPRLVVEWKPLGPPAGIVTVDIAAWEMEARRVRDEHASLLSLGQWVSGPLDLMTIMGRARDELSHSAVLAWALNPTGRHGLGTRLLTAILEEGWKDGQTPNATTVTVQREVKMDSRRADIIVHADDMILVIENKLDAVENAGQCEDTYQLWSRQAGDVRFLLVTVDGHEPGSTRTMEAAEAWRSVSYAALRTLLEELLADVPTRADMSAMDQYGQTLDRLFPVRERFVIRAGGGHVD
jgi:hypothetical protein